MMYNEIMSRKETMNKVLQIILMFLLLGKSAEVAYAEESAGEQLEEKYFRTLDEWVKKGGPTNEIQGVVVNTCGKLVMLNASLAEKAALSTTQRDEFDHRVDVCVKMTVNRVHPQPELRKRLLESFVTKVTLASSRNFAKGTAFGENNGTHNPVFHRTRKNIGPLLPRFLAVPLGS
jgi:hypothetical protein